MNFTPAPDGRGGFVPPKEHGQFLKSLIGHQAPGAILNGHRIRKIGSEPKDRTPNGTAGTVLGSIGGTAVFDSIVINGIAIDYGYIVKWDNDENAEGVFIVNFKVEELES